MGEYIERQAAIDEIEEWYELYPDSDAAREALSLVKRRIKRLQPANVKPVVRGRWIDYDDDYGAYCCSVCEQDAPEDTKWPYCPNCAADMRGGDAQ